MSPRPDADAAAEARLGPLLDRLTGYYPRAIDPNLVRSERLAADLGHPQRKLPPVIHIAGTNGKGSTLATIRAIAEAADLTCHVMTSPHLVRFNERFVIAGQEIETPALIDLLEEAERVNRGQETTFFELVTVAGFLAFARARADLCLVETGMGGRLDATNIVEAPLATVITVISSDHTQYLGTTLEEIAGEKAGIIKPGAPCIVGPQTPDGLRAGVMDVFADRAAELHAPLYRHGYDWSYEPTGAGFVLHTGMDSYDFPRPNLLGPHQIGNAATAAMTLLTVRPDLPGSAYDHGITHVRWPARLQRLQSGELAPLLPKAWELWLDGGHNDTGGQVLAAQAALWQEQDQRDLHLVLGMLDTKDPLEFLRPLAPHISSLHTLTIPDQPRSFTAEALAALARTVLPSGIQAIPAASPAAALNCIAACASPRDRVLITGSLYLAGHILQTNS